MSDGLLIGRSRVWLDPRTAIGGQRELFAAQLLDDATITGQTFQHCTFANVSFKGATLDRCKFVNCAFIDCYFRDTRIRNSSLAACKFERCSFSEPEFVGCTFTFLEFRGCFIPFARFSDALPSDPGYRHRLADELAREAAAGGALRDAREYRLVGEDAYERHVWNLAWASGAPYYEKRRPVPLRVRFGLTWLARKFNRLLWGYGERGLILARSFLIVALVFPLLFRVFAADELTPSSSLDVPGYLLFSLDNLLNSPGFSRIEPTGAVAQWLTAAEVLAGLMFIGLFITFVFNWIRRR